MTTEDEFQAALDANPADGVTRQEFADWIAAKTRREVAFRRARSFGDRVYELVRAVAAGTDILRYLVV